MSSHMMTSKFLLALLPVVAADFAGNINYGSPSHLHNLAISVPKVRKRHATEHVNAANVTFTHGVASGDPYADSIILWTRASPTSDNDQSNVTVSGTAALYNHDTQQYVEASQNTVCVEWTISEYESLQNATACGKAYTSSDIDYTVKVEASGLSPFTWYYYQFNICGSSETKSPLGRTKTAPSHDQDVTDVGIAVFSCSNFPLGFFNAYGNSARKDNVDYVVHLGDYLYEYGASPPSRRHRPERDILTLYDYRARHATYRTDEDLLLSASMYPWIPTWDDHEVSDNTYRDGSSALNNTEASFEETGISVDQRKMNAVRAYFEWMPIRQVDMDDNLRIWRSFQLGNLLDLIILDTRQYDRSITDVYTNTDYIAEISNDSGRTLMGSNQENWFYNTLKRSAKRGATWRIVGSQVVFSTLNMSSPDSDQVFNLDAWDGYTANKNRVLNTLYENDIGNNIFLAGDTHVNWVSDLTWTGQKPYNATTGDGGIGVEFAGTAVSSTSSFGANLTIAGANAMSQMLVDNNPVLHWSEGYYRGYFELQISKERVLANFFGTPSLETRNGFEVSLSNFTVQAGANRLSRPIAGDGGVENGALQGSTKAAVTNLTVDTNTGEYFIHQFGRVNIPREPSV